MSLFLPKTTSPAIVLAGSGGDLLWTCGGLAGNSGRVSDTIDNSTLRADAGFLTISCVAGTTAPITGTQLRLYLIRRSLHGTPLLAGSGHVPGTSDAAVTIEPANTKLLAAFTTRASATAGELTRETTLVMLPGEYFQFLLWNAHGGVAGNALGAAFTAHWNPIQREDV